MSNRDWKLSDFDFDLPHELLAEFPAQRRDESRLMVIHRGSGKIEHKIFRDIANYFKSGDALVINNTKVIPARIEARKENPETGARIEVMLIREAESGKHEWVAMLGNARRLKPGQRLYFGDSSLTAIYNGALSDKERLLTFETEASPIDLKRKLFELGTLPLPPYIKRAATAEDQKRYQTVYARNEGSIAAPTAGLHFTAELIDKMKSTGISFPEVTLEVGLGTFNPVKVENITEHEMHSERYVVEKTTANAINSVDRSAHLLCAVGTTSMRTLESASDDNGMIEPGSSHTSLFIYPPYQFKTANALLTNFHTPKSTLLMMISAFMGYEKMKDVYSLAIKEKYRFFSYGDAMLILP